MFAELVFKNLEKMDSPWSQNWWCNQVLWTQRTKRFKFQACNTVLQAQLDQTALISVRITTHARTGQSAGSLRTGRSPTSVSVEQGRVVSIVRTRHLWPVPWPGGASQSAVLVTVLRIRDLKSPAIRIMVPAHAEWVVRTMFQMWNLMLPIWFMVIMFFQTW